MSSCATVRPHSAPGVSSWSLRAPVKAKPVCVRLESQRANKNKNTTRREREKKTVKRHTLVIKGYNFMFTASAAIYIINIYTVIIVSISMLLRFCLQPVSEADRGKGPSLTLQCCIELLCRQWPETNSLKTLCLYAAKPAVAAKRGGHWGLTAFISQSHLLILNLTRRR